MLLLSIAFEEAFRVHENLCMECMVSGILLRRRCIRARGNARASGYSERIFSHPPRRYGFTYRRQRYVIGITCRANRIPRCRCHKGLLIATARHQRSIRIRTNSIFPELRKYYPLLNVATMHISLSSFELQLSSVTITETLRMFRSFPQVS